MSRFAWRRRLARLIDDWVVETGRDDLRADAVAGVLGALLMLPHAVAFAMLATLPPQVGLATAIVPCIVAALAGWNRHVVTGPTNALSLALLATLALLAPLGSAASVELAFAVTLLVAASQLAIGVLRLGKKRRACAAEGINPLGIGAGSSMPVDNQRRPTGLS